MPNLPSYIYFGREDRQLIKGGGRNPYTLGPEVCGGQHLHNSIGNHPIDLTLSLGSDPGRYCISMVNIIVKKHRNHSDFTQILPNLAEMRPYTMYFGFPLFPDIFRASVLSFDREGL